MGKIEGYNKVAVIKLNMGKYYFALYDEKDEYKPGDCVIVSGGKTPNPVYIEDIIYPEEAAQKIGKNIVAEVMGKVDLTSYNERQLKRKEKEELRKKLDKRREVIKSHLDDDYYASKDIEYASLLEKYREL